MSLVTRRTCLTGLAGIGLAALTRGADGSLKMPMLGFSLYGMRTLDPVEAVEFCADVGYESVELPLMADWPLDAQSVTNETLDRIRGTLQRRRLKLAGCMEHLVLTGSDQQHQATLKRWKDALRVARRLDPDEAPLVETILGGKPAEWPDLRDLFVRRLRDWARVAEDQRAVIAIKAHVGGAAHLPEHIRWLVEEVSSPAIRAAYDYSHFQLRGLELGATLETLLPLTSFIHVKDARGQAGAFQFLLPGQGQTDYADYFRRLQRAGYRGSVVVEVSGQIHQRADYDPRAAAKTSLAALRQARDAI